TPDRFRELQWTRLPGGETPPTFVERVQRLLSPAAPPEPAYAASVPQSLGVTAQSSAPAARGALRALIWGLTLVAVVAIVMYYTSRWSVVPQGGGETRRTAAVAAGAEAIPEKSIAVLPFLDLSERKDQEYF